MATDPMAGVEGLTEEEQDIIKLVRAMGLKPKLDTPEDKVAIAKVLTEGTTALKPVGIKKEPGSTVTPPSAFKHPSLPTFYGDPNKGESTWATFRHHVLTHTGGDLYTPPQILYGVRQAIKGKAAEKLIQLEPSATLEEIMNKLESEYGPIESGETVMKNFFTCQQQQKESVIKYSERLESLFYKAADLKQLDRKDKTILKKTLHSGLRTDLKHASLYLRDSTSNYDDFKIELKRMELDLEQDPTKPCKPVTSTDNNEITKLLKQLNDRMEKLEKQQQQPDNQHQYNRSEDEFAEPNWYSGRGMPSQRWRGGHRGRGSEHRGGNANPHRGRGYQDRGRGFYRPSRPYGSGTMSPTCFVCGLKGHIQVNCPTITSQFTCIKCNEKGHMKKDCPN